MSLENSKDAFHCSLVLNSLCQIYKEGNLCDISLVVGANEIKCHKIVLAANSPYFYTMFTSNLMESTLSKVALKEVDYQVVQLLIDYCYSSTINFDSTNVESLLKAAHLLGFETIVAKCCHYMTSQLQPANCLGISNFAEVHGCTSLRDSALNFAIYNVSQVAKMDEFYLATFDQISKLLSSDFLNVPSEMDAFDIAMSWVNHDAEFRKGFLPQILELVRMDLLPPKVIVDCIEKNQLIASDPVCLQTINKVKTTQLLPELLDLRSLVINRERQSDKYLYVIGGEIHNSIYNTVDCYDFNNDRWTSLANLNIPRDGLGVATYNGLIFAAGGCDGDVALESVECYHPRENSWNFVKPMANNRHAFSLVELQGWLYAVGGSDFFHTEFDTVERYDPVRDCWLEVTPMITKREGLQVASLNGALYAIGGDNGLTILSSVERYDPRLGYWNVCQSMCYKRRYFGSAVLRNQIVVLGGSNCDEDHNSMEVFDMRMNRWLPLPPLPTRRESPAAAAIGNKLYAIGGAFMNEETDSIDVYNAVENKWDSFTPLLRAMEGMCAAVL